jgi:hypothetical protein
MLKLWLVLCLVLSSYLGKAMVSVRFGLMAMANTNASVRTIARLELNLRLRLGVMLGFELKLGTVRGFEWQVSTSFHAACMCISTSNKVAQK